MLDCTSSVTSSTKTLATNIKMEFEEVSHERERLEKNYETYWKVLRKSNELEEKIIKSKSLLYLTLQELKSLKEQILKERLNEAE